MGAPGSAARCWREDLASWAIPKEILDAAPESPWTFPVELFARRADAAMESSTVSTDVARAAVPPGGSVLDVGCGAGAASVPLVPPAAELFGLDTSPDMLEAFAERARSTGATAGAIEGRWPDVADEAPVTDVVVCHHVFYNAGELPAFALALTAHARRRVVVELTHSHPQSTLNDLWVQFHGLERPTRPTADDAMAVLREAGLDPQREDWRAPTSGGFADRRDLVAWIRRRLCLTVDRDPELEAALQDRIIERDGLFGFERPPLVTLWWPGGV